MEHFSRQDKAFIGRQQILCTVQSTAAISGHSLLCLVGVQFLALDKAGWTQTLTAFSFVNGRKSDKPVQKCHPTDTATAWLIKL
jgi:hypothetical protein